MNANVMRKPGVKDTEAMVGMNRSIRSGDMSTSLGGRIIAGFESVSEHM